jgi:hypothetical protein
MHFELKPISREAIPEALQKVKRYRLLNEPAHAESICLDILNIEPHNQQALVMLLLALTDQFSDGVSPGRAREVAAHLKSPYDREYYNGMIWERSAQALLRRGAPNASFAAYDAYLRAMDYYERAQGLRSPGNDDSILRWNSCARVLNGNPNLRQHPEEEFNPLLNE